MPRETEAPVSDGSVRIDADGAVRVLTISNPSKRNALNPTILGALERIFRTFDAEGVRCVVVRGEGDTAFSAGYDIDRIPNHEGSGHEYVTTAYPLTGMFAALERMGPPIIAMLNGHAFGAGLDLAVSCDLRVARPGVKLAMPPAKLGIIYSHTGIQRFIDLVGVGFAKEMFLRGAPIDADEAERIGLVNHVWPAEELEARTLAMAQEIAANAPLSVQGTRRIFQMLRTNQLLTEDQHREILEIRARSHQSEDAREGKAAFAERRKPRFEGR